MSRTQENIKRLTEQHLERFNGMLEAHKKGERYRGTYLVVEAEANKYLGIWNSIKDKGYDFDKLNEEEKNEVLDAILDEG